MKTPPKKKYFHNEFLEAIYFEDFDLIYHYFPNGATSSTLLMKGQSYVYEFQKKVNCLNLIYDSTDRPIEIDRPTVKLMSEKFNDFFAFQKGTRNALFIGKFYKDEDWKYFNEINHDNPGTSIRFTGDLRESIDFIYLDRISEEEKIKIVEVIQRQLKKQ